MTRNLLCGCNVVIVNVYLSYDLFFTIINVNDIPNLFGSLQKMKIPQVQSDIDFEVVNSYTTDLICVDNIITVDDKSTWIGHTEKNGFISPDFVKSFISELSPLDRSTCMSLFDVNVMS
jgi:hypothetical protein